MKSNFTLLFIFFQVVLTAQVMWQEHFNTTEINVLSTQTLSGGKAFNLVGVKDGTLYSLGLNGKQQIINNNTFDKKNRLVPQAIYTSNGKNYLMISKDDDTLRYAAVNLTGRLIWEKSFYLKGKINAGCVTANQEIVMVGQKEDRKFVCKFNQSGELIWEHTFGPGELLDVEITSDGGVMVAGYVTMYFSPDSDFFIAKLDTNGKNEWERAYGEPDKIEKAYLITITSNNQIMVVGQRDKAIWMLQINKEQEVDWEEQIGKQNEEFIPTSICPTSNGQTIFTANVQSKNANNHLFVARLNNSFGGQPNEPSKKKSKENSSNDKVEFSLVRVSNREKLPLEFQRKEDIYQEMTTTTLTNKIEIYGLKSELYETYVIYFDKNRKAHFSPILDTKTQNKNAELLTKLKLPKNTPLIIIASNETLNEKKIEQKLSQKNNLKESLFDVFSTVNMNSEEVIFDEEMIQVCTAFEKPQTLVFVLKLK